MEKFKLGDKVRIVVGLNKGCLGHVVWENNGFYTIELLDKSYIIKVAAWIEHTKGGN